MNGNTALIVAGMVAIPVAFGLYMSNRRDEIPTPRAPMPNVRPAWNPPAQRTLPPAGESPRFGTSTVRQVTVPPSSAPTTSFRPVRSSVRPTRFR